MTATDHLAAPAVTHTSITSTTSTSSTSSGARARPARAASDTPARPTQAAPGAPEHHAPAARPQRGFVLWVGVDPDATDPRTAEIVELAEALGELAREILPTAETYTALSLGETSGGRGGGRTGELGALRDRLAHLQLVDRTTAERDTAEPQAQPQASLSVPASAARPQPPSRAAAHDAEHRPSGPQSAPARPGPGTSSAVAPRLSIDLPSRRVSIHGVEQRLTYKEFELLAYLATSVGRVVPRSELFASVWRSRAAEPGSRTIDVHVRRLRDKLGLELEILTVRGAGYRFEPSSDVSLVQVRQAG